MKIDVEKTKMNLRKVFRCEEKVEEAMEKIKKYSPYVGPPFLVPPKEEGKIDVETLDRYIELVK